MPSSRWVGKLRGAPGWSELPSLSSGALSIPVVGKGSPPRASDPVLLQPRGRYQDCGQNPIQGGKKRNNGYSSLCQGHNLPPHPISKSLNDPKHQHSEAGGRSRTIPYSAAGSLLGDSGVASRTGGRGRQWCPGLLPFPSYAVSLLGNKEHRLCVQRQRSRPFQLCEEASVSSSVWGPGEATSMGEFEDEMKEWI